MRDGDVLGLIVVGAFVLSAVLALRPNRRCRDRDETPRVESDAP